MIHITSCLHLRLYLFFSGLQLIYKIVAYRDSNVSLFKSELNFSFEFEWTSLLFLYANSAEVKALISSGLVDNDLFHSSLEAILRIFLIGGGVRPESGKFASINAVILRAISFISFVSLCNSTPAVA